MNALRPNSSPPSPPTRIALPRRATTITLAVVLSALAAPRAAHADPPVAHADPDPWCGPDKALHFTLAIGIAGGGYGIGALASDEIAPRIVASASAALAAVLAKELVDAAGFGTPSAKDAVWGLAGAAVGLGISISFDLALRPPARALKPK